MGAQWRARIVTGAAPHAAARSHTLPSPSRTRAAVRGWLSVRASRCRAPAASSTQKGRSSRSRAHLSTDREGGIAFSKVPRGSFPHLTHIARGNSDLFPFLLCRWPWHRIPPLISHWPAQIFRSILRRRVRVCAVNGMGLEIDPTWNAQTALSTGQTAFNQHIFKSDVMRVSPTPFGCYMWRYGEKAKARFFVLCAPFSLQLIDWSLCGSIRHSAANGAVSIRASRSIDVVFHGSLSLNDTVITLIWNVSIFG